MSVYKVQPWSKYFSYRFQMDGKKYSGVCVGCEKREKALRYEAKIRNACIRLSSQNTLNDLFENCKDMIIRKNPIALDTAFDCAMQKPRRRTPGEARERFKRNYWNDFAAFVKANHADILCLQSVTNSIAEEYISFVRKNGSFKQNSEGFGKTLYSNLTLNEIHSTLAQVFELLKYDSGMPENPFDGIEKLQSDSDSHEPYTFDELKTIFDNADDFIYPVFMIGLFSGMRLGDICTLRKSDIVLDRHFIIRKMRKTSGTASIPMHEILEKYIREIMDKSGESEYLLPEHAETYLKNPSIISARVKTFLESNGIQTMKKVEGRTHAVNIKGVHSLRHTFCTIAGVAGIPESVLRSIVGHMTPEMTHLYTRYIEESEKLKYIQFFGDKISYIQKLNAPCDLIEDEREKLICMIRELPIEKVREIMENLNNGN